MKDFIIETIRKYQYYPEGSLEAKGEEEIREIYKMLIDWIY